MDSETYEAIKALQKRLSHLSEIIGFLKVTALQHDRDIKKLQQPMRDPAHVQPLS